LELGFITRTGFATYALNTPPADTPSTTLPSRPGRTACPKSQSGGYARADRKRADYAS